MAAFPRELDHYSSAQRLFGTLNPPIAINGSLMVEPFLVMAAVQIALTTCSSQRLNNIFRLNLKKRQ